jgi:hypothetical protein
LHAFNAKAVDVLRFKGVLISPEEENVVHCYFIARYRAWSFSHAMEKSIVEDVHHEEISLLFMNQLNVEFNGQLSLAIQVLKENTIENSCCS